MHLPKLFKMHSLTSVIFPIKTSKEFLSGSNMFYVYDFFLRFVCVFFLENQGVFFLHDPNFVIVSVFSSSLKILPTIIIYHDCFHCYFYCGSNTHLWRGKLKKIILAEKVDSMAIRKTIKIFLFLIPFLQS